MRFAAAEIRAVVFDLDDTLYPELQYVRSGFHAVAERLGNQEHNEAEVFDLLWRFFEHGQRDKVFNQVLKETGRQEDQQIIAELVTLYRCHRPKLILEQRVEEMLRELSKRYKLGLITDGFLPAQQLKIEALGVEKYFNHIIYTEQMGREFWKPSIQAFELMEEQLGFHAGQCVYVADNPGKDFVGPNKLGWQTVQVKGAHGIHGEVEVADGGGPTVIVGDVCEILELLYTRSRA